MVLGTRSAVFAPLDHIGLIVLDEEQESSYKSENAPRYHARDVAKYRCVQHRAVLLLGSATPAVESMYQAREGRYRLFPPEPTLQPTGHAAGPHCGYEAGAAGGGTAPPSVRSCAGSWPATWNVGEQSILFLNRRGSSRMVSCGECGQVPECPRCSVRLTYHSANGRLMCHYCGYSEPPSSCVSSCGGRLNFIGVGTQRVQEELEALFPGIEILRMDADTISAAHPHEELLSRFQKQRVPILVGTQMVAKGLDFDNVTLVGGGGRRSVPLCRRLPRRGSAPSL